MTSFEQGDRVRVTGGDPYWIGDVGQVTNLYPVSAGDGTTEVLMYTGASAGWNVMFKPEDLQYLGD